MLSLTLLDLCLLLGGLFAAVVVVEVAVYVVGAGWVRVKDDGDLHE